MIKFLKKLFLLFFLPCLLLIVMAIIWDPLKVFFRYDDYYKIRHAELNREDICLTVYLKNNPAEKYNSFILGNSRSQAFKIADWARCFKSSDNFKGFHFDGSSEGLYRMTNQVKFLSKTADTLKNLLLIIDPSTLLESSNSKDVMYIQPPLISGESKLTYYNSFIKASLDLDFIAQYLSSFFPRLKKMFPGYYGKDDENKIPMTYDFDEKTGDLYWSWDQYIKKDSVLFYQKRAKAGIFYDRATRKKPASSRDSLPGEAIQRLKEIRNTCAEHHTNVKIVLPPLYDQIKAGPILLSTLNSIFGAQNIYDYSGVNDITNNISNYYEHSHFRPFVARKIMQDIYCKP